MSYKALSDNNNKSNDNNLKEQQRYPFTGAGFIPPRCELSTLGNISFKFHLIPILNSLYR